MIVAALASPEARASMIASADAHTAIPDRWPGRRTKAARFDGRAFFPERTAARPAALAPIG